MNIKGHTEIQVRDAKTGRIVQHTHDDNMVTNGLAVFLKNHGMLNTTPFSEPVNNDLLTTLLGGILLFNDSLPASADTTFCPDGVKMTANAAHGITYTGDPTELGSYDANESGWQDAAHTTYRFVYNWTESQGNGVIKSAALTSKAHGFVGEGNSQSESYTSNNNLDYQTYSNQTSIGSRDYSHSEQVFAIKNNAAYSYKMDTSNQILAIYKGSINDTICDVRNVRILANANFDLVAELENPSSNVQYAGYGWCSVRFLNNAVIYAMRSSNGFLVLTLDSTLENITDYAEITAAATGLTFNNGDTFFLSADGEYLITYNISSSKFYKIEVANPTNITEITNHGASMVIARELYHAGKRHYCGNYIYDETLDTIYANNNGWNPSDLACIYKDSPGLIVWMSGTNRVNGDSNRNNGYLATVNNLQNAVTKDSTQTMKVIYTLTFS